MIEWVFSSCVLILVILALRALLQGKVGAYLPYALWALVLLRLLIPVSFGSSGISVLNVLDARAGQAEQAITASHDTVTPPQEDTLPSPDTPPIPSQTPQTDAADQTGNAVPAAAHTPDWDVAVRVLYVAGMGAVGALLVITRICFAVRIRKSRRVLAGVEARLPVYVTQAVETPCLAGLFRPVIYVTPQAAQDPLVLRHILVHETMHYRHGDHIWSVLRGVCLVLHWYNPLVWCAAFLSRNDAELACDQAAIRHIGEQERTAYARTLIGMTCSRRPVLSATVSAMTGSRRNIQKRIRNIAAKKKPAVSMLVVMALAAALAAGCTFTGAADNQKPEQGVTDARSVTIEGEIEAPDAVIAYAKDFVLEQIQYYETMWQSIQPQCAVTQAKITGLTLCTPETPGQSDGLNLYLLKYRLLIDNADDLVLAGGMVTEETDSETWLTEWGSAGQPYLLLHWDKSSGQTQWERICVTNTDIINTDYGTPAMLSQYGDPYTAAAAQLYERFLSTYTMNDVSIILEPGFTLRENGYPCFTRDNDSVLVSMELIDPETTTLTSHTPGDEPLDLESLSQNAYGDWYLDYVFEGEYHYVVFRPFASGIVVVEMMCRGYAQEEYAPLFQEWASSAAPVITAETP